MPEHKVTDQTVAKLLGPAGHEIGCDECFAQLDRYVELELAGADPEQAVPGMGAHLRGCPACGEEHEALRSYLQTLS
jgi:hypothetical protein